MELYIRMKKLVIYYLTDDTNSPRELDEIVLLKQFGKVVLVSSGENNKNFQVHMLPVKSYTLLQSRVHNFWMRLSRILSRIPNSPANYNFSERNVYIKSKFLTKIVNSIWVVKNIKWINKALPCFDSVFFMPFHIFQYFKYGSSSENKSVYSRVVVYDPILVRLGALTPFLSLARSRNIKTIANVKSWDNPSYVQFAGKADGYLVWSHSMWEDIQIIQGVANRNVFSWGARQFIRFISVVQDAESSRKINKLYEPKKIVAGYAAAFGDRLMGEYEVSLIKSIAKYLENLFPDLIVLFRPYPSVDTSFYESLNDCSNVVIQNIDGKMIDRFGDGREFVRFGSEIERLNYLYKCDLFLSLATTFSIEAAIAGVPILHIFFDQGSRESLAEKQIFRRIDFSDHIVQYYNCNLEIANNYSEIVTWISNFMNSDTVYSHSGDRLLEKLGINLLANKTERINSELSIFLENVVNCND